MKWVKNSFGEWEKSYNDIYVVLYQDHKYGDKFLLEINIYGTNSSPGYLKKDCKDIEEAKLQADLQLSQLILDLMKIVK